jgi:hypothetical protein
MPVHRWWTKAELRSTTETVYPEALVGRLEELGDGNRVNDRK